jgi:NAD(P)-dependent dehydrogenase (short-subunit alcohol dehydrogenase family)
MDLTDRVIVITGAGTGIGAATAIECARAGLHVVLNGRRAERLDEVALRVREMGRRAIAIVGSVTDEGMSERLLDAAEIELGRLDAVFANAGYGLDRAGVDETEEELRRIFEVNFFASVDLVKRAARRLVAAQRPGSLLMCSSCLSKFSLPNHGAYAATKAAQNLVCRAMRLELMPHGIHVARTATSRCPATPRASSCSAPSASPARSCAACAAPSPKCGRAARSRPWPRS